jgi:hypothetical protein
VLYSSHCERFLRDHLALLKANEWALLFQIIQIMRTACRVNGTYLDQKVLVPEGASWSAVLKILQEDKTNIPEKFLATLEATLEDWKLGVLTSSMLPAGTRDAGQLTLYLLELYQSRTGMGHRRDTRTEKLVKLIFAFAGGITAELKTDFDRAPALLDLDRTKGNNSRLLQYGESLLDLALKGPDASQLARYLPDVILELATERWYRKPRPKLVGMEEMLAQMTERSQLDKSFRFGLASDNPFSGTESAFSTPLLWLLEYHTDRALNFVIALLNHATRHYKENADPDDAISTINLRLPDGTTSQQTASASLWSMYRGHTAYANPLLTSILMALEKYLLSLGSQGEVKGQHFRHCLSVLLKQSQTVATTAVVASAVQAYPLLAAEWVLAVLDQKDFYYWDIYRYTRDRQSPFFFQDGSLDVRERTASHLLPHRTQYDGGLRGFIIYYCITIGVYNQQIADMIDQQLAAADPSDLNWRKTLEQIDGRRLVRGKEVEINGQSGFMIETEFSPEVAASVEAFRMQHEMEREEMTQASELKNAFDGKQVMTLDRWLQIYDHYQTLTQINSLRHAPGLLAAVGIRDFWPHLNEGQQKAAISVVGQVADDFAIEGLTGPRLGFLNVNIYDTSAVLQVLPQLLSNPDINQHANDRYQAEEMIFRVLVSHYEDNNPDYNKFLTALDRYFWPAEPTLAARMWQGALALGSGTQMLPNPQAFETQQSYLDAVYSFISDYYKKVRAGEVSIDVENIDLGKFEKWALSRAIHHIPAHEPPAPILTFTRAVILAYLRLNADSKQQREDNYHEIRHLLQNKLAKIFFESALGVGPMLMDFFCKQILTETVLKSIIAGNNELVNFFLDTMKQTIFITDNALKEDLAPHQRTVQLFQAMWKAFHNTSSEIERAVFWSTLLLNIDWKASARTWAPIQGMKDFFNFYIESGTAIYPAAAINLLATIGDQELLPAALITLVAELQKAGQFNNINLYTDTKAEQLAHRIYDYHLEAVRVQPALMEAYQWLLRRLIDLGSTDAYWLNEFVIAYHRQHDN